MATIVPVKPQSRTNDDPAGSFTMNSALRLKEQLTELLLSPNAAGIFNASAEGVGMAPECPIALREGAESILGGSSDVPIPELIAHLQANNAWFGGVVTTIATTMTPAMSWDDLRPDSPKQEATLLLAHAAALQELSRYTGFVLGQHLEQQQDVSTEDGAASGDDPFLMLSLKSEVEVMVKKCLLTRKEVVRHRRFTNFARETAPTPARAPSHGVGSVASGLRGRNGSFISLPLPPPYEDAEDAAGEPLGFDEVDNDGKDDDDGKHVEKEEAQDEASREILKGQLQRLCAALSDPLHPVGSQIHTYTTSIQSMYTAMNTKSTSKRKDRGSMSKRLRASLNPAMAEEELENLAEGIAEFVDETLQWLRSNTNTLFVDGGKNQPASPAKTSGAASTLFSATASRVHWEEDEVGSEMQPLTEGLPEFSDALLIAAIEDVLYDAAVHEAIFNGYCADEENDRIAEQQCTRCQGLAQDVLHVPEQYRGQGLLPYIEGISMLRTVPLYKTPSRKLAVIRDAASSLLREMDANLTRYNARLEATMSEGFASPLSLNNNSMKMAAETPARDGDSAHLIAFGGDDFVPVFVYALLQANIPRLATEMQFISNGLEDSLRNGEVGYFATTFELGVEYIKRCNFYDESEAANSRSPRRSLSMKKGAGATAGHNAQDDQLLFAIPQIAQAKRWVDASCGKLEAVSFDAVLETITITADTEDVVIPSSSLQLTVVEDLLLDPIHPMKAFVEVTEGRSPTYAAASGLRVALLRFAAPPPSATNSTGADAQEEFINRFFLMSDVSTAVNGVAAVSSAVRYTSPVNGPTEVVASTILLQKRKAFEKHLITGAHKVKRGLQQGSGGHPQAHDMVASHLSATLMPIAHICEVFSGATALSSVPVSAVTFRALKGRDYDAAVRVLLDELMQASWPGGLLDHTLGSLCFSFKGGEHPQWSGDQEHGVAFVTAATKNPLWLAKACGAPCTCDTQKCIVLAQHLLVVLGCLPTPHLVSGLPDTASYRALELALRPDGWLKRQSERTSSNLWVQFVETAVPIVLEAATSLQKQHHRSDKIFVESIVAWGPGGLASRIKQFQQHRGLLPDGRCGEDTLRVLRSMM